MQRLPPEALMHVFSHIGPTLAHFDWVCNIMAVCRRWKNILLRTPRFWADLIEGSSWHFYGFHSIRLDADVWRRFRFAVVKSGRLPLQLYITCLDDRVADFLFPHRYRISTLVISQKFPHVHGPGINRLVRAGLPGLARLSIAYVHYEGGYADRDFRMAYPHIDSTLMPQLRTLDIPGHHFAGNNTLHSLRHLTLGECGWQRWCSCGSESHALDSLLRALEQCHELETLALQGVPVTHDGGTTDRVVRLNGLRDLRIEGTAQSIFTYLTHLVFAPTISLYLSITPGDGTFLDVLPPTVEVAVLGAYDIQRVHFRGLPRSCSVDIYGAHGQEMRVTESREEDEVDGYDRQLLQTVGLFSQVPRVDVEVDGQDSASASTLREVWTEFRGLRSFRMADCDCRFYLLPFMASLEGQQSLHALEHLSITWNCAYDGWFFMNRRRGERDSIVTNGCNASVPVWPTPYDASACEAFCDLLTPVLASEPFTDCLQSLEVLICPSPTDGYTPGAGDMAVIQALLHERLDSLVQELTVVLYRRRPRFTLSRQAVMYRYPQA